MTTLVHIGDLHLHSAHARNADRLRAFDQIIDENVNRQDLAAWLIPGDIFHTRSLAQDRNDVAERLQRMAHNAPVILIFGNHDQSQDLQIFAKLKAEWPITVVDRPHVVTIPLATGRTAAIWCVPYPHRSGLVSAGVPSDRIVDAARQALDAMFMQAAAELADAAADGKITLAMAHVNIGGSIMSTGQPSIGTEIELDPGLISRLGGIYVGCNHVHKAQEIGGAWYAGSCCRLDFSEREDKRYLTVTYHREDVGWAYVVESHPIDVAPMLHVNGELTRDGFTWDVEGGTPHSFVGAEVRVRYRFNADEKSALDETLVRVPFAGAKRLELDPIAIKNRASRAPDVAAAITLEGKVEAFVRQSGVAWTPGAETKLAALQKPGDGAAFLTEVQQSLSGAGEVQPARPSGGPADPTRASSEAAPDTELTGVPL